MDRNDMMFIWIIRAFSTASIRKDLDTITKKAVDNAIESLGDTQHAALFLKYCHGYTTDRISAVLGISRRTALRAISRGRKRLITYICTCIAAAPLVHWRIECAARKHFMEKYEIYITHDVPALSVKAGDQLVFTKCPARNGDIVLVFFGTEFSVRRYPDIDNGSVEGVIERLSRYI